MQHLSSKKKKKKKRKKKKKKQKQMLHYKICTKSVVCSMSHRLNKTYLQTNGCIKMSRGVNPHSVYRDGNICYHSSRSVHQAIYIYRVR